MQGAHNFFISHLLKQINVGVSQKIILHAKIFNAWLIFIKTVCFPLWSDQIAQKSQKLSAASQIKVGDQYVYVAIPTD